MMVDELFFVPEPEDLVPGSPVPPWRVLIVDDEPDVFRVSRLVLGGLQIDGVPVLLEGCASAREARMWLETHPDTAAILLDVVMENEHAGLDLARWIRSDLNDPLVRIVLRTGQPGRAPEAEVIASYDIHDYLPKADITRTRLITTLTGAVRAYRDLRTITAQRSGLRRVIDAAATLLDSSEVTVLLGGILEQVASLLFPKEHALFFVARTPLFAPAGGPPRVVAATGSFASCVGKPMANVIDAAMLADIERALSSGRDVWSSQGSAHVFGLAEGVTAALYVVGDSALGEWEQTLVSLYAGSTGWALRHLKLGAERESLLHAFSRFVPNDMIRLLGRDDVRAIDIGEHVVRDLTVLFVDLVGFTHRTEAMAPVEVFGLLNTFYGAIGPALMAHGGIVDKYLGDGAMVLFPAGASAAVSAAVEICAALDELNGSGRLGGAPLRVGVAIHRGPVILGTIGHAERLDITAVSDTVNTAARLQGWTRTMAARLIVSEAVVASLGDASTDIQLRPLGSLTMRGRGASVVAWERIDAEEPQRREVKMRTRALFSAAVALRAEGRLLEAARLFNDVLLDDPADDAAMWFSRRCVGEFQADRTPPVVG